ncbi:alpha/beta hydrolase [Actibacterium sp. XHP0104]|uniref:alpha/beta hydrolase n=1 Tax=Actibacterium sp. XHP0104 TaxID=2984335 RepID=UPI0021E92028|nr:alpha/beta fold hydrolase [Actibacterium sp. XHP0104]MCV2881186.1 dienelactone hydrolase family protein [Actibacterium sp. XHP0104]
MTRELKFGRRGPEQGQATSLVVFLHGYGADGADLLGLADPLSPHMSGTAFVAPDAPDRCAGSPFGYQWFPIPWIDGSTDEQRDEGMDEAVEDLHVFLDKLMADEGLSADRVILFGFSQGTMMSLHIAPRRTEPFAGVVGFSGRLLHPDMLADDTISRPPVLLVHGDMDDVVPVQSLPEAGEALSEAGFEVYAHIMKGTPHGIAPDGLSVALTFMRNRLGMD